MSKVYGFCFIVIIIFIIIIEIVIHYRRKCVLCSFFFFFYLSSCLFIYPSVDLFSIHLLFCTLIYVSLNNRLDE